MPLHCYWGSNIIPQWQEYCELAFENLTHFVRSFTNDFHKAFLVQDCTALNDTKCTQNTRLRHAILSLQDRYNFKSISSNFL
jgi:hypothetical protein